MSTRPIPRTNFIEFCRWLFGLRRRYTVSGRSMLPLLPPGAEVLVRSCSLEDLQLGDVVVVRHPYRREVEMVKLVSDFGDDGDMILSGLNPEESTDSRVWGAVPGHHLRGVVTSRL